MKKYVLIALCCLMCTISAMAQNGLAPDGWYEYTVSEGNLSELISEDLKYQITKLRLKGKINSTDFRLIRDMAGLDYSNSATEGKLECLDLSGTEIVKGGQPYRSGTAICPANKIGDYMFKDCLSLKEISTGNTVKLGSYAFSGCLNLTTVYCPYVEELGECCFTGCSLLSIANFPKLSVVKNGVFQNCISLEDISLPKAVSIGSNAFSKCSKLKAITALNLIEIGQSAFYACESLISVDFPILELIGTSCFHNCKALKSVNLGKVENLPSQFFYACYSLETVKCPNVTSIAYGVCAECRSLKSIECQKVVEIGNSAFEQCSLLESIECPNVEKIGQKTFKGCSSLKSIKCPNVMNIGTEAFYSCSSLQTIECPNVIYIGGSAFELCSKLRSINIQSVEVIGKRTFFECALQQNLSLPNIRKIEELAFFKNKIDTIEIGENVDTIGFYALSDVTNILLKTKRVPTIYPTEGRYVQGNPNTNVKGLSEMGTIVVPNEVHKTYLSADNWSEFNTRIIPDNVQTNCIVNVEAQQATSGLLQSVGEECLKNIIKLSIKGSINGYDIMIIRNKMHNLHYLDLTDVIIKANPYEYYGNYHTEDDRIGNYMFYELNKLVEVKLPSSIKYIGLNSFGNCSFLESVILAPSITTIDQSAFTDCVSLKKLTIPSSVITINNYAFYKCEKLDTVMIDEGTRKIGQSCFGYCSGLTHIKLPNSLEEIAANSFESCKNLTYIDFQNNLRIIGNGAFRGCNTLKEIVFPNNLHTIGNNAFENCTNLSKVYISPSIETIGKTAFQGCGNIKDVYTYIANAKDIKIDQNTFNCWTTASLHVPNFAFDTYYWDTQWSQFAHLDEFDEKYESFYSKNTITLDKGTGTITGTPDATLHENGGLVVNDEEKQELDEIQLKSDGTNGATLIPENTGNIKAKKVDITIKVKGNKWHFFCFPFDVPLSGMKYEGEYVWRRYDGAKRSRREGGWQNLAAGTTTLEAGRGYIFQGTADGELTLSIDNPEITASDVKTGLEVYPSDNSQDASWNFVGNPYVSYYSIDATTYSSPITIWNGTGYEAYRPGDDDYMFHPYQAFFVQTPVDATEIGFDATARESFEQSQTTLAAAKARRAARKMNVNRLLANLELFAAGDTAYMDKTRIVFNDKENMEYDAVSDAAKFMSSERAAEFYTLDSKNVQYAINERPMAGGDVRMGFIANKAGEYRIAQSRSDVEMLLIDHQEGITHNLGTGAYTFSSGAGTFDNRFTLKVNGQETGITELKEKTGIDLTVDGELCINGAAEEVTTTVYQLNGVLAGTIQGNGSLRLPKGIYAVKVGLLTLKVQI